MMFAAAGDQGQAMQVGLWIITATAVMQFMAGAIGLAKFFMNRSERRDVSISPGVATKADFDHLVAENKMAHDRFDVRIGGVDRSAKAALDVKLEEHRRERKEDMRILHTEINTVSSKVAGLETATSLQNQSLASISAKLDRIAERD